MARDNLSPEKYPKNYLEKLHYVRQEIEKGLRGKNKFGGIIFTDVSAGGIQVRILHNDIKGYSYGEQYTIDYDFSNLEYVIENVISEWYRIDNPGMVKEYKEMLANGEKYGWD